MNYLYVYYKFSLHLIIYQSYADRFIWQRRRMQRVIFHFQYTICRNLIIHKRFFIVEVCAHIVQIFVKSLTL